MENRCEVSGQAVVVLSSLPVDHRCKVGQSLRSFAVGLASQAGIERVDDVVERPVAGLLKGGWCDEVRPCYWLVIATTTGHAGTKAPTESRYDGSP